MKYGIALFPSKKLQDLANSYRKRYDPHYALIPPHITVKPAFETEVDSKEITTTLDNIAQQIQSLNISIQKVSSFEPINNTIYFKVEKTAELDAFYNTLYKSIPAAEPEHPFVPHVTIAQKLSNDEHSDVFEQLKMLGVQHEETIDRFHLLYQLDNGSWTVFETFKFTGDHT